MPWFVTTCLIQHAAAHDAVFHMLLVLVRQPRKVKKNKGRVCISSIWSLIEFWKCRVFDLVMIIAVIDPYINSYSSFDKLFWCHQGHGPLKQTGHMFD